MVIHEYNMLYFRERRSVLLVKREESSKRLCENRNALIYLSFITSVLVLSIACINSGGVILASDSNAIKIFEVAGNLGDNVYEHMLGLVNIVAAIWFIGNLIKIIVVSSDRSMDQAKRKLLIIFACLCGAHGIGYVFQLAQDVTTDAPSLDMFDVGVKSISPSNN